MKRQQVQQAAKEAANNGGGQRRRSNNDNGNDNSETTATTTNTVSKIMKKKQNEPPFALYQSSTSSTSPSFEEGFESVIQLLRGVKKIVVLTGAGISVSCGIPDFRTKGTGLYSTLDAQDLGLSCPEELFDFDFFLDNPQPFFNFARNLYFPNLGNPDDQVRPSDSHKLLALLEQKHKLLRVYSQNIDGLEQEAGVSSKKVVYAHGSLKWATCCKCKRKVDADAIKEHVWKRVVATCQAPLSTSTTSTTKATASAMSAGSTSNSSSSTMTRSSTKTNNNNDNTSNNHGGVYTSSSSSRSTRKRLRVNGVNGSVDQQESSSQSQSEPSSSFSTLAASTSSGAAVCGGVLKPGVTFFGETLHDNVRRCLEADRNKVDALIVMGTSLSVAPISKVIGYLPANIPRILINRTIVHPSSCGVPEDVSDDADDNNNSTSKEDDSNNSSKNRDFRDDYLFDAYLLGFCDDVTRALAKRLFPGNKTKSSNSCSSDNNNSTMSSSGSDQKKRPLLSSSAEEEGKLLACLDNEDELYNKQDWTLSKIASKIPPERIFLFPGAQAPVDANNDNDDASELTYREIAHCDGCSEHIVGTIHKCVTCFDFDLCHECFPVLSKEHHDGKHQFVEEIARPLVVGET